MARRLTLILLAVITFQFSWAVISNYCMHESGRAANHFGHHQHHASAEELSLAAKDGSHLNKKASGHDAHCAYVYVAGAPVNSAESWGRIDDVSSAVLRPTASPSSVIPSPPERPQWSRRA